MESKREIVIGIIVGLLTMAYYLWAWFMMGYPETVARWSLVGLMVAWVISEFRKK